MAVEPAAPPASVGETHRTVFVDTFTDGLIGPDVEMLGPVEDGGHIVVNTTPGLLGADDHAVDPRRARGRSAGGGRRRRGGRRDRDPHQGHRGHLDRHRVRQRRVAGGQLQRRPLLRARLPGLRHGVAGDAARGHRPGVGALRELRRRRHALQVHERLHDRLRRRASGGRDAAARGGGADRPRGGALRRAARALGTEPDPRVRAARPRRARDAPAAVHGPARHDAVDHDPGLAQRGRLRLVPDRRAAPLRAHRRGARTAPDRRPHGHRRRARRGDPDLPGEGAGRRDLHGRHARAPGRRRDRRPHLRRVGHRDPAGRGHQGARASTGRCCSRSRRTCPSSPGRSQAPSARARRRSRASGGSTGSRSRRRSRWWAADPT